MIYDLLNSGSTNGGKHNQQDFVSQNTRAFLEFISLLTNVKRKTRKRFLVTLTADVRQRSFCCFSHIQVRFTIRWKFTFSCFFRLKLCSDEHQSQLGTDLRAVKNSQTINKVICVFAKSFSFTRKLRCNYEQEGELLTLKSHSLRWEKWSAKHRLTILFRVQIKVTKLF